MNLLASIKPEDVDASVQPADYAAYITRLAGRAIVFDRQKVALIRVGKHGYYMLPGGGMDSDDIATGLAREIREELGAEIRIDTEVGVIEVYFDRWQQKQIDHCFTAHLSDKGGQTARTSFEIEEGHEIVWAKDLDKAIALIASASPEQRDGKQVRARDLKFLQACKGRELHRRQQ